jgi:hypothetical protein
MNQSASEQVVSSDLNRIGNLAGRELMDAAMARSVRADFYLPETNTFNDFQPALATPIAGLTQEPSINGGAGVFDVAVGAGEADLPFTSQSPDLSDYQILRWPQQLVTWPTSGAPDPSNPRICTIVATPGDAMADLTSRNILVDPNTRLTSPENVFKTINPLATLSVVVGLAAATPVAAAIPAGTLALFDVYVPAGVTDSTYYLFTRRAWRKIEFPGTSQHGILKGCVPQLISPSARGLSPGIHRVVVDGELLTFSLGSTYLPIIAESTHPAGSAPANNDKPTYLYLCGGRNQPVVTRAFPGTTIAPMYLIETTVAPDPLGYPQADLALATPAVTFPRAACVFVGCGFIAANGTAGAPCFYVDDWVYAAANIVTGSHSTRAFCEPLETSGTGGGLASQPACSTAVLLGLVADGGSGTISDGGGVILDSTQARLSGPALIALPNSITWTVASGTIRPSPVAYNMNVPRIGR